MAYETDDKFEQMAQALPEASDVKPIPSNNFPQFKPPGGYGTGPGWGGDARGAGRGGQFSLQKSGEPNRFLTPRTEQQIAEREERKRRSEEMKKIIYDLAHNADREETRLNAARAYLDREEGMPVSRNLNINANSEVAEMDDNELARRRLELERAIAGRAGPMPSEPEPAPVGGWRGPRDPDPLCGGA
jgi:hypothetical protein